MKCKVCDGTGEVVEFYEPELGTAYSSCWRCGGKGEISLWNFIKGEYWQNYAPEWHFNFMVWMTDRKERRSLQAEEEE